MPEIQRLPGGLDDFEGARDTLPVAGLQSRRAFGIETLELRMEIASGVAPFRANRRGYRRNLRKALLERLEVETSSAGEYRQQSAAPGCFDLFPCRCKPARDRPRLAAAHAAIKLVRNIGFFFGRRARRQNTKLAIDLHRVGVDDHASPLARHIEGERRLAARGRPCDKHGALVCRHFEWTPSSSS